MTTSGGSGQAGKQNSSQTMKLMSPASASAKQQPTATGELVEAPNANNNDNVKRQVSARGAGEPEAVKQTTAETATATTSAITLQQTAGQSGENENERQHHPHNHQQDDEGLGTGSSSGQSSASGSHCDDRETPPHVDMQPGDVLPLGAAAATGESFGDTVSSNAEVAVLKPTKSEKRNGSSGPKSKRLGKSRAMTWSASLGSLGASLRGHLSGSSGRGGQSAAAAAEKSRSEANLVDPDVQQATTSGDSTCEETASILFHTECFNCCTCSELLVDLRALIYINEPTTNTNSQSVNKRHANDNNHHLKSTRRPRRSSSCEYVNLDQEFQDEDQVFHDDTRLQAASRHCFPQSYHQQPQVVSLFCHRHFVELFKPRCQQCDCLILDEECTEAEGKFYSHSYIFITFSLLL